MTHIMMAAVHYVCFRRGTYEISGCLICVGQSALIFMSFLVCLLLMSCEVQIKMGVDCLNIWYCCVRSCWGQNVYVLFLCVGIVWSWNVLLCWSDIFGVGIVWRCFAMYGLTLVMESNGSKFWIWTGSGPNLWDMKQK